MTGSRQTSGGVVQTSGGVAQTADTTLLIDNWESGDQRHWTNTGDTSVTTTSLLGTYSLEHTSASFIKVTSGTGITDPAPNYPAKGATVSWVVDTDALATDIWLVAFGSGNGTSSSDYNIHVNLQADGDVALREEVAGTESAIAADTTSPAAANAVYEATLQWHNGDDAPNNDATATLYEYDTTTATRGTQVAQVQGTVDPSHDSNNNGAVELWFGGDATQVERVDEVRILNGKTL